ncbi:unnamed protein product [marine sediment metagenome]|uniref:Uncharacterized protein n=1 Tax=marine sediment metagenome TaxID=412755 RepID=X0T8E2_9ZZZZ
MDNTLSAKARQAAQAEGQMLSSMARVPRPSAEEQVESLRSTGTAADRNRADSLGTELARAEHREDLKGLAEDRQELMKEPDGPLRERQLQDLDATIQETREALGAVVNPHHERVKQVADLRKKIAETDELDVADEYRQEIREIELGGAA